MVRICSDHRKQILFNLYVIKNAYILSLPDFWDMYTVLVWKGLLLYLFYPLRYIDSCLFWRIVEATEKFHLFYFTQANKKTLSIFSLLPHPQVLSTSFCLGICYVWKYLPAPELWTDVFHSGCWGIQQLSCSFLDETHNSEIFWTRPASYLFRNPITGQHRKQEFVLKYGDDKFIGAMYALQKNWIAITWSYRKPCMWYCVIWKDLSALFENSQCKLQFKKKEEKERKW